MASRNGSVAAPHAGACALRLTSEEDAWLDRALPALTAREREVVRALCTGGANEALADRLCVALPTLRTHLMRINQKIGSESKDDIVRFVAARLLDAYRQGELPAWDGRAPARLGVVEAKGAHGEGAFRAPSEAGAAGSGNHRYR